MNMSIVMEILEELWNTELNYKGIKVNIFGIPRFKQYSSKSVRATIDRLKRKGVIEKELTGIVLSKYGKEYVRRKIDSLKQFDRPENISKDKNLLVMFDIPVEKKGEREWFRWHLKKFGYIMIQHSVWVGPSPLPKEFLDYVKSIKLDKCIKTFKLEKPYK
ncbi:MAG TPA: CRISPR-associated endonuclease Cas2 [Candidatus Paceibacterota bacterium]|nr:CRISPR-associated endonuclease Cas2 [Candidatus Paceibacterota bacterium]